MRTTIALSLAVLFLVPALRAQGEGNGFDAALSAGIFPVPTSDLDQHVLAGDPFIIHIDSASIFGNPILFFSDAPCGGPQPNYAFAGVPGVIGIDPNNVAVMFDAFQAPFVAIIGPSGTWQYSLVLPDFVGFENREDIFLQGAVFDPSSGAPFGWMVTNTIRLMTVQDGVYQDTLFHTDCQAPLDDSDVGVPWTVDTSAWNDAYTINGVAPGSGATSSFSIDPHPLFVLNGSRDVATRFTTAVGGQFRFELCGSAFDATLALAAFPSRAPLLFCDDDQTGACPGDPTAPVLETCLAPGETVYVLIDGAGVASQGLTQLLITPIGPCPTGGGSGF
ncbi:MAG: hypothetical protein R3F20_01575 [Planctomycetota bacterium]